jgi:hypothetical protein
MRVLLLFLAASMLAACSGNAANGSNNSALPQIAGSPARTDATAASHRRIGEHITIRLRVPRRHRKHNTGDYISSNTSYIQILSAWTSAGAAPSNPTKETTDLYRACTNGHGPFVTCTVTLAIPFSPNGLTSPTFEIEFNLLDGSTPQAVLSTTNGFSTCLAQPYTTNPGPANISCDFLFSPVVGFVTVSQDAPIISGSSSSAQINWSLADPDNVPLTPTVGLTGSAAGIDACLLGDHSNRLTIAPSGALALPLALSGQTTTSKSGGEPACMSGSSGLIAAPTATSIDAAGVGFAATDSGAITTATQAFAFNTAAAGWSGQSVSFRYTILPANPTLFASATSPAKTVTIPTPPGFAGTTVTRMDECWYLSVTTNSGKTAVQTNDPQGLGLIAGPPQIIDNGVPSATSGGTPATFQFAPEQSGACLYHAIFEPNAAPATNSAEFGVFVGSAQ